MFQRLLMGKAKSCPTCNDFDTPPCYDCTFNMNHPPPNYASLSRHDRCHSYSRPPSSICIQHSLPALPQMDLDPPYDTSEYFFDDTDFEVSRLTQAVSRIGLGVAFLGNERQTENVADPEDSHTNTPQNLSVHIPVPRSAAHIQFPRNSSAPELTLEASEGSPCGHRPSENHLLLTAISSHVSDHQVASSAPSSDLSSREPSPLPCQLLIPE